MCAADRRPYLKVLLCALVDRIRRPNQIHLRVYMYSNSVRLSTRHQLLSTPPHLTTLRISLVRWYDYAQRQVEAEQTQTHLSSREHARHVERSPIFPLPLPTSSRPYLQLIATDDSMHHARKLCPLRTSNSRLHSSFTSSTSSTAAAASRCVGSARQQRQASERAAPTQQRKKSE